MFFFLVFSTAARLIKLPLMKNENKIHLNHFQIELKSKETRFRVAFDFNSKRKRSKYILSLFRSPTLACCEKKIGKIKKNDGLTDDVYTMIGITDFVPR